VAEAQRMSDLVSGDQGDDEALLSGETTISEAGQPDLGVHELLRSALLLVPQGGVAFQHRRTPPEPDAQVGTFRSGLHELDARTALGPSPQRASDRPAMLRRPDVDGHDLRAFRLAFQHVGTRRALPSKGRKSEHKTHCKCSAKSARTTTTAGGTGDHQEVG
jgi:hypothetical protein